MRQYLIIFLTMTLILTACSPVVNESSQRIAIPTASLSTEIPLETPAYVSPTVKGAYNLSDFIATGILGRPTDTSVTMSVVPKMAMALYCEYGTFMGTYSARTPSQIASGGIPLEILMDGLEPDTRYYYRIRYNDSAGPEHTFITQRSTGGSFTFAVQADSHLNTDKHCDPDLYRQTMLNIAVSQPDFLIDLGDTFRTDKLNTINPETISQLYIDQRQYFGLLSASASLFLANGNHEMEWGWLLDGSADNPAVWSANLRNQYFPEPAPDNFYSGDTNIVENIGMLRDYYAWKWGEALFVVIDPYWSTITDPKKSRDNWDWTLGETQYQWFRQTLKTSNAKYKFVFTHHLLGENRGGIEAAPYFEWGGMNRNGSWGFDTYRPRWGVPIHQLMVDNHVTVFFQGHDHLFAKEALDGLIYQTLPMPANTNDAIPNQEFYPSATMLPGSGYLLVEVSPEQVSVSFVRSFIPQEEKPDQHNGQVDYTYTITPSGH